MRSQTTAVTTYNLFLMHFCPTVNTVEVGFNAIITSATNDTQVNLTLTLTMPFTVTGLDLYTDASANSVTSHAKVYYREEFSGEMTETSISQVNTKWKY